MAIFIKNENGLSKQLKEVKHESSIFIFFILASALLSICLAPINIFFAPAPLIATMFFIIKFSRNAHKQGMLESGLEGEKTTEQVLKKLPNHYYVHSDLHIEFDDGESQLDHVVVGPTGIFVIESKNLNGDIEGDAKEKHWTQNKKGRGGGEYENEFYSPVKQVGTHVYRLSGVLKERGYDNWIHSCVFFSHPDTQVKVKSEKVPVFSYQDEGDKKLMKFIKHKRKTLSPKDIQKINEIIKIENKNN